MIEATFKAEILPYLYRHKIILAFANERAIQRTADAFVAFGIPKSQLFGLIGQSPQVERVGLDIAHAFVALPECTLAFELRAYHRALQELDEAQLAAIDDFDPSGEAIVIGAFWFALSSVANRRVFGRRHPSWIRFEDKCEVAFIWDKAGIAQAKNQVIPVSLLQISLPDGWTYPFVISGDSRDGITGGASHVRAIHSKEQLEKAMPFFEQECDQLRLMEYVDGIPCSIHGVVLADEVLSSIPIEMVVIPRSDGRFMYMGASTHWVPNPSVQAHLKDTVCKVGAVLREEAGFRGTFTIDGILKDGQFYPTEINTRAGAGIFALYGADHTSYFLLDLMLKDGQAIELDATALQDWMHQTAASHRSTRAWGGASISCDCPIETHSLSFDSGQWVRIEDEAEGATTLSISEGRIGAFMMLFVSHETLSSGECLNPYVQAAMQYCDSTWSTHFLN